MRRRNSIVPSALGLIVLLYLVTPPVQAQTNYTAQNFNTNFGYKRSVGITTTNQPLALRWQGNDAYSSVTLRGETDVISRALGYTPSPLANSSLLQGGNGVANGVLPGTNKVRLWKTFAPPVTGSSVFFAEWSLIPSLEGAPYNRADTFAFDLRNAANTQSLLTLQFTPGINVQAGSYTMQSIAAGYGTNTIVDLAYQALFQVTVAMTSSNWNLSLAQINSSTRAVLASYTNLASGNLATGTTALDFATLGLNWDLASTNNLEPGSNYIIANQFTVVPEPSTISLFVFGATAAAIVVLYRRRA